MPRLEFLEPALVALAAVLLAGCSVISVAISPPAPRAGRGDRGGRGPVEGPPDGSLRRPLRGQLLSLPSPTRRRPGYRSSPASARSLRRAEKTTRVKALVASGSNSPGGTITASDVIYREIRSSRRGGRSRRSRLSSTSGRLGAGHRRRPGRRPDPRPPHQRHGSIGVVMLTLNAQAAREDRVAPLSIKSGAMKMRARRLRGSSRPRSAPYSRASSTRCSGASWA